MGVALVTLPDGLKARVTFDTPEQLDATVDDLVHQHTVHPFSERMSDNPVTRGVGEAGLQAASGMFGAAAGGVLGVARGAGAGVASLAMGEGAGKAADAFADEATHTIENTERAMTYQPKTAEGKAVSSAVAAPFTWLAGKADKAGEAVSGAVKSGAQALGASEDTAGRLGAGAGAVTNTALQAAPSLVAGGASRLSGAAAAREALAARPRVEPTLEPTSAPRTAATPSAAPSPELSATGAPRQPYSTVGAGQAKVSPNTQKAMNYARDHGLDWTKLGAGVRKALETIVQDSKALNNLSPAALKREALLQSQRIPVPATRGMLERDTAALRREGVLSPLDAGQPIRSIEVGANRAIQGNLEILRGRAGGLKGGLHDPVDDEGLPAATPSIREQTPPPTQVGAPVQKAARTKMEWAKKGADALYDTARKTDPEASVPAKALHDLLENNPDIQHLGFLQSWLAKAAKTKAGAENFRLADLHDLRELAGEIGKTPTTDGVYARKVVKTVDAMMKQIPESAKAWKAADKAWSKYKAEFSDQPGVKALVSQKKSGGLPAVPHEGTWAHVAKGSLENLRQVKRTMLTGGTPQIREMGRRAWRGIRAETVNRILGKARSIVTTDETEREVLTAAALYNAITEIPRENLEEILGKRNTRELLDIARTARITKTGRSPQSGTVTNVLGLAEKAIGHAAGHVIPGAGMLSRGAKAVRNAVKTKGDIKRAVTTPLQDALEQATKTATSRKRQQQYRSLETSPTLPPTIGDLQKPP